MDGFARRSARRVDLIAVAEKFNVDRRFLRKTLPAAGFTIRKAGQQKRQS